ncbi:MAG: NAD(+) synthase [Wujia sp.]
MYDFYRIAAAVPDIRVADVNYNKNKIIDMIREADRQNVRIIAFPELALTGYSCGDLFLQTELWNAVRQALAEITEITEQLNMLIILGTPLYSGYQLYNTGMLLYRGKIQGIHVKTFLPNYNEFYEKRWFSSAADLPADEISSVDVLGYGCPEYTIPIGNDILFQINHSLTLGMEICEDAWAPLTPSTWLAMAGAELIINLSASNDTIGKRDFRRRLVQNKSTSLICEYLYVSAGSGESSTDLIFSGHSIIAENGRIIRENSEIAANDYLMVTDIDTGKIKADRLKGKSFKDAYRLYGSQEYIRTIEIESEDISSDGAMYTINPHPFIPASKSRRLERCKDIFDMQVGGLKKRLSVTGSKMVIGVSGGMDSTLALLVGAQTLKKLDRPMTDLVGITMPAFGTTDRTYQNALALMDKLGISVKTIPIKEACTIHYKDIGHNMADKDITFENVQARERTQVLMDYANKIGGIVVGTGDLSELALGWCTYNADQMSMYGVNASIPKTLVKWLIDSVIEYDLFPDCSNILQDIIDTPISPELLPPDENGNIIQKTEDSVGPYELHDFFMYYMMRFGYTPGKIFYMAERAFHDVYDRDTILKWMKMFYRRFFSQQFKRSCMPDGVKVGSVCLSPRGDWRMPSDAVASLWLQELENL